MADIQEILARAVERSTGLDIEEIRRTPLDELRRRSEREHGAPIRFISMFPFIGRGNVLRDRTLSHERVEAELKDALRDAD